MYAYFALIRTSTIFLEQWIMREFLLLRVALNKVLSSVQLQHVLGKSPSGGVCRAVLLSLGNGVILSRLAKIYAKCKHTLILVGLGSSVSDCSIICWTQLQRRKHKDKDKHAYNKVNSTDMQPRFSFIHSRCNSCPYNLFNSYLLGNHLRFWKFTSKC